MKYFYLVLFNILTVASAAWVPADLDEAVERGSAFWVCHYLEEGTYAAEELNPNLGKAVKSGDFEMARALLLAGADAKTYLKDIGHTIDVGDVASPEALAMHYLLRSYAFIREYARPLPPGHSVLNERVAVYEPTIDYTHPEIEPYYYVNEAEKAGETGVDDDANGFVDDVYGWSPFAGEAHAVDPMQEDLYSSNTALIQELIGIHNRMALGELEEDSLEVVKLKRSFRNPLARILGESSGYSDYEFMKNLIGLSHGTHVAGTIIDASDRKARIHTLSWDPFGKDDGFTFEAPELRPNESFDSYLDRVGTDSFDAFVQKGRETSDYLRVHRIGIVNASMGDPAGVFLLPALERVKEIAEYDPNVEENFDAHVRRLAYELYAYYLIPYIITVAENPDIVFVAASGNDSQSVDYTLDAPAYLSRFFDNVITVAAATQDGGLASFSNIGHKSVNVAAPGVNIRSFGLGGTRLYMDGTSMAAPYVAGLVLSLREMYPSLSPKKLRLLLENGSRRDESFRGSVRSGGVVDLNRSESVFVGLTESLREALWSGVLNDDPDARPHAWLDIRNRLRDSVAINRQSNELIYTYSVALDVVGDPAEALKAINQAIELNPAVVKYWRSKMIILGNLDDTQRQVDTVLAFMESGAYDPEALNSHVSQIFSWGAGAAEMLLQYDLARAWGELEARHDPDSANPSSSSAAVAPSRPVTTLQVSRELQEIGGALAESDPQMGDSFVDFFTIELRKGNSFMFALKSSQFDAVLEVESPGGETWLNDDYNSATTNSGLQGVAGQTGTYTVSVRSYDGGLGAYQLAWLVETP